MKPAPFISAIAFGLIALFAIGTSQAEIKYRMTLIDNPGGIQQLVSVAGLNNKGEVAGYVGDFGGRAFLWRNGQFIDMAAIIDPQSQFVEISGINDRSDLVGVRYNLDYVNRAFLYRNGERVDIGSELPGSVLTGAMNNARQVLTFVEQLGRDALWRNGEFKTLEELPGSEEFGTRANNLNDLGIVTGRSGTLDSYRAVIWRRGEVEALAAVPGATLSEGIAINNFGQVAGHAYFADETGGLSRRAYLWYRGGATPLPNLVSNPHATSVSGLNDLGMVVGTTFVDVSDAVPTLWWGQSAFDINTLIADSDPLKPFVRFSQARLVNELGQIVVDGVDSRGMSLDRKYLLTPTLAD